MPHNLLKVAQAAAHVGLSESTMNKLRLTGDGPTYVKLGSRVLYDMRDLDAWISARRRQSTSSSGEAA